MISLKHQEIQFFKPSKNKDTGDEDDRYKCLKA